MLTEIEQDTFINYYEEDLSLSEIAENRSISKSSVGKTLSLTENKLKEYEEKLNFLKTKEELNNILEIKNIDELKEKIKNIIG